MNNLTRNYGQRREDPESSRGRPRCGSWWLVHRQVNEASRMTQDDMLFGRRLQLFALAAERGVSEACRLMGMHRSTYCRWKRQVAVGAGDAQAAGAAPSGDAHPALGHS